jgi:CO/xanthine dehydrogenase Mo-binding subunit
VETQIKVVADRLGMDAEELRRVRMAGDLVEPPLSET